MGRFAAGKAIAILVFCLILAGVGAGDGFAQYSHTVILDTRILSTQPSEGLRGTTPEELSYDLGERVVHYLLQQGVDPGKVITIEDEGDLPVGGDSVGEIVYVWLGTYGESGPYGRDASGFWSLPLREQTKEDMFLAEEIASRVERVSGFTRVAGQLETTGHLDALVKTKAAGTPNAFSVGAVIYAANISNPHDEQLFLDPASRDVFAQGVAEGILAYITSGQQRENKTSKLSEYAESMLSQGDFSIFVKSLTRDETVYWHNPDKALIPASNQKIITSVSAYYLLGPDYRFRTEMYIDKDVDVVEGLYRGPIAFRGYGDPTFRTIDLSDMILELDAFGIEKIEGDIYVDDSWFSTERWGEGWTYEVADPVSPVFLRDGFLGTMGDPDWKIPNYFGVNVKLELESLRFDFEGEIRVEPVPPHLELTAVKTSPPLLEILSIGNKKSDNSIMEQVFRATGAEVKGLGGVAESEDAIKEFWNGKVGLAPNSYEVFDGSGLSHSNRVSASALVAMLEFAYSHPFADLDGASQPQAEELHEMLAEGKHPFIETLSVAGVDGTLSGRMKDLKVWGKTGTLNGVDALCGYVLGADRELYAFAILVNNFTVDRQVLRDWEDGFVALIARP